MHEFVKVRIVIIKTGTPWFLMTTPQRYAAIIRRQKENSSAVHIFREKG